MKRVSISEWQEMAMKKDIEQIRKKIFSQESIVFSLCWELMIALGSIIAEHVFDIEKAPVLIWIFVIVLAVVPILVVLSCSIIKWIRAIVSTKKGKYKIREYIDVFDNQISYWVMLSNAYTNMLIGATTNSDDEIEFLYREGCYYNNKVMMALYGMKPNFDKIFCDDLEKTRKENLIDLERLYNIISVMNEQQIKLDCAVQDLKRPGIYSQAELNKGYLKELKAFLNDVNTRFPKREITWRTA